MSGITRAREKSVAKSVQVPPPSQKRPVGTELEESTRRAPFSVITGRWIAWYPLDVVLNVLSCHVRLS